VLWFKIKDQTIYLKKKKTDRHVMMNESVKKRKLDNCNKYNENVLILCYII